MKWLLTWILATGFFMAGLAWLVHEIPAVADQTWPLLTVGFGTLLFFELGRQTP